MILKIYNMFIYRMQRNYDQIDKKLFVKQNTLL